MILVRTPRAAVIYRLSPRTACAKGVAATALSQRRLEQLDRSYSNQTALTTDPPRKSGRCPPRAALCGSCQKQLRINSAMSRHTSELHHRAPSTSSSFSPS